MDVLSQQRLRAAITHHVDARRIAESAIAIEVDTKDRLCRGIQQEPDKSFLVAQGSCRLL